ncbi:MAG: TerB N-terminal domain-containing protein [Planctomycetes bacterium]|nr:TerB N-terminal domain-containing protein [Planctomycetota bacterium]MBL7009548.1 TerB N-terminal domain-containing protein [Planctomycetota bacterium]
MKRLLGWAGLVAASLIVARLLALRARKRDGAVPEPGQTRRPSAPAGGASQVRESRPSPSVTSAACWVPPGRAAEVRGLPVPSGLVYIGRGLAAVHGGGIEPCLIDPDLPVSAAGAAFELGYWPSYSRIPEAARAALLRWMAGGRKDPAIDIGCVFLAFYALERRALHDAESDPAARAELPSILAEVERLLGIYSGSRSFRGYASSFADFLCFELGAGAMREGPPPAGSPNGELPLAVRITAATCAIRGEGLPAAWALSWVRSDPEIKLRTPAARCPLEFERLFLLRYRARHGDGLRLKPCKGLVQVRYRPASPSFDAEVERKTGFPDVCALMAPRRRLQELAEECCDALAPFSRRAGREGDPGFALEATALLPADLVAAHPPGELLMLREALAALLGQQEIAVVQAEEALGPWLTAGAGKLSKKASLQLGRLVSHAGFGLEPDLRFGGPAYQQGQPVALFRLDQERHSSPTAAYRAAALLLHLSALVSAADGSVSEAEERRLEAHLAEGMQLDAEERLRLHAHLRWQLAAPQGTVGLKKRLEALDAERRRGIGLFLVQVAWSDGRIEAGEVRVLEKIYRLLGLDPAQVHEDLHGGGPAAEPRPATLDPEALARKLEETAAVSSLLSGIFEDPQPAPAAAAAAPVVEGLDAAHSALFQRLGERPAWPRADYEALAEELGVLPDGALDILNEYAFERCDEPLIEGDELLEVQTRIHQQLKP